MRVAAVAGIVMNLRPFVSIIAGYRPLPEGDRLDWLSMEDAADRVVAAVARRLELAELARWSTALGRTPSSSVAAAASVRAMPAGTLIVGVAVRLASVWPGVDTVSTGFV